MLKFSFLRGTKEAKGRIFYDQEHVFLVLILGESKKRTVFNQSFFVSPRILGNSWNDFCMDGKGFLGKGN